MPRPMPRYDLQLRAQSTVIQQIVVAGEVSRDRWSSGRRYWTRSNLESLYELAYMRVFGFWEITLEAALLRSVCGYASRYGQETVTPGYCPSLHLAKCTVYGTNRHGQTRPFLLWHDPSDVIARCNRHITSGKQASALASFKTLLEHYGAIRHRIAHDHQQDARSKFDSACLAIAGRTYHGSRAGSLLREWNPVSNPPERRLDTIINHLVGLTSQFV